MQQLILDTIKNYTVTTYLIVFVGAALLSMGSCTWIRIPVVVGYIGGTAASRKASFVMTLAFVAGCVLSYVFMGILLGTVSAMAVHLLYLSIFLYAGAGVILIIIGLYMLGFIRLKSAESKIESFRSKRRTVFGAFFFGMIFAFLEAPACPCCGPVLLLIAMGTFPAGDFGYGISLFLVYALGQNVPILLVGSATGMLKSFGEKARLMEKVIHIGGGIILTLLGIFFIWMA